MPEWLFPISPVAASRPRVSRHGAYFTGPYKRFRQEMAEIVPLILGKSFIPLEGPLDVTLDLFVKQPQKTKLDAPKADIDNYIKSILDCMNKHLWLDDTQVITIQATKQWAHKKHDGHFIIGVRPHEH